MNATEQQSDLFVPASTLIPNDVLCAYFEQTDIEGLNARQLAGGTVNTTWLVERKLSDSNNTADVPANDRERTIIQALNDQFDEGLVHDGATVAEALNEKGWAAPRTIATAIGSLAFRGTTGKLYRAAEYVESKTRPMAEPAPEDYSGYGRLLGRFHADLANSTYEPEHRIPHFHDTDYYADRLTEQLNSMPNAGAATVASQLLAAYEQLPSMPETEEQLLHGDPRLDNYLFDENGKPFTIIDYDTVMRGSIWIDIGDAVRSMAKNAVVDGNTLGPEHIRHYTEGYQQGSGNVQDSAEFFKAAIGAAKQIAIELAMRYAIDIVEDNYFNWDEKKFPDRQTNHMARITIQQNVVSMLDKIQKKYELAK